MDIDKLKEQLIIDEGVKYEIYFDHLGYKTFGIGHLIKENEPEYHLPVGTKISEERVNQAFEEDCSIIELECIEWLESETLWESLPEEVKQIVANMMFNMGRPRLSKFKNFRSAIIRRDWMEAANQMEDSRWYNQVGNRSVRLVTRMRSVG